MSKPLVSVWCSTFNHENYISQAIEGMLQQETNFEVEFFIHDDASTDSTADIIRSYAAHSAQLEAILLTENKFGKDKSYLNRIMFEKTTGKYVALCEGDDYWTDPFKLQKQINFLEANPDFAICFHAVEVVYEGIGKESYISNPNTKSVTAFEDLATGNYIHTPSCVFRNHLFGDLPEWFLECPAGDYPLHLLNAQWGKIKFLPDVMAVYRVHSGGVWSWGDRVDPTRGMLKVVEICRKHFAPRAERQFSRTIDDLNKDLSILAFENGDYDECRRRYHQCPDKLRRYGLRTSSALAVRNFLSRLPKAAGLYRRFMSRSSSELL